MAGNTEGTAGKCTENKLLVSSECLSSNKTTGEKQTDKKNRQQAYKHKGSIYTSHIQPRKHRWRSGEVLGDEKELRRNVMTIKFKITTHKYPEAMLRNSAIKSLFFCFHTDRATASRIRTHDSKFCESWFCDLYLQVLPGSSSSSSSKWFRPLMERERKEKKPKPNKQKKRVLSRCAHNPKHPTFPNSLLLIFMYLFFILSLVALLSGCPPVSPEGTVNGKACAPVSLVTSRLERSKWREILQSRKN